MYRRAGRQSELYLVRCGRYRYTIRHKREVNANGNILFGIREPTRAETKFQAVQRRRTSCQAGHTTFSNGASAVMSTSSLWRNEHRSKLRRWSKKAKGTSDACSKTRSYSGRPTGPYFDRGLNAPGPSMIMLVHVALTCRANAG